MLSSWSTAASVDGEMDLVGKQEGVLVGENGAKKGEAGRERE